MPEFDSFHTTGPSAEEMADMIDAMEASGHRPPLSDFDPTPEFLRRATMRFIYGGLDEAA